MHSHNHTCIRISILRHMSLNLQILKNFSFKKKQPRFRCACAHGSLHMAF